MEGEVIVTVFENGSFRPLRPLELAEESQVELELVRIVWRKDESRRVLLEEDEVELRLLRVEPPAERSAGRR
jgi:predicted DNA-binding antitoxin AbrB/MazE fold protein